MKDENPWILPETKRQIEESMRYRQQKIIDELQTSQAQKPLNYVILDAALWSSDINSAFHLCPSYRSLFATKGADRDLNEVAPYLFPYAENTYFSEWIHDKEKKGLRVLYVSSDETLEGLRKHLRRFLRVKTEEGKWLFFRFYDPSVAEITLPYFNDNQSFFFYLKLNYLTFFEKRTKEYIVLQPSVNVLSEIMKQQENHSYPILVIDKQLQQKIAKAKVDRYKKETTTKLLEQQILNISYWEDAFAFISKQIDEALKWGFKIDKECYDFLLLSIQYKVLVNENMPEKLIVILADNKKNSIKKINQIKKILETDERYRY